MTATSRPTRPTAPDALREALQRVDERGRFHLADGAALREFVAQARRGEWASADHPAELFGEWEALPATAQLGLRRIVECEIRGTMQWFPHGRLWTGAIRRCWEMDRYIVEMKRFRPLRKHLIVGANRLSGGPINLRRRLLRRHQLRQWQRGRTTLEALLAALGRDPHWLCGDFVTGVRVDPRALGFHHDAHRNATVGYHVALDLMPTPDGMVCLEGNLQGGFLTRPRSLQPDNPTGHAMIAAARAHGVRRILWHEGHRIPLPQWFLAEMRTLGEPFGIETEFCQDPRVPSRRDLPTDTITDPARRPWITPVPSDTLVVRRNEFTVGSDFVLNDKEPFVRGLHAIFSRQSNPVVQVLPQTRQAHIAPGSFERGLPNVVYKYPDGLSGTGVFFLRVRTADDAHRLAREIDARTGEAPGLFQQFAASVSSAIGGVQDYRAEIFITPLGTWFLGAIRRVSGHPMPAFLPEGVVQNSALFTSNMSTGGALESAGDDELAMIEPAAIAVGDALREVLSATFDVGAPR